MFMNDNSVSKLTCNACMYSVLTVSVLVLGIGSDRGGLIRPPMWLTFPSEPSHGCHALILLFHTTLMFCSPHHLQLLKDILNSVSSVWWLGIIANKSDFELMTSLLQKTKISLCLGSQRPQLLKTMGLYICDLCWQDFLSIQNPKWVCLDFCYWSFLFLHIHTYRICYIYIHLWDPK